MLVREKRCNQDGSTVTYLHRGQNPPARPGAIAARVGNPGPRLGTRAFGSRIPALSQGEVREGPFTAKTQRTRRKSFLEVNPNRCS